MKQLPNDKELDELVEMGRLLEEKAKKFSNLADKFVKKYKKRLRDRTKSGGKKQEIK